MLIEIVMKRMILPKNKAHDTQVGSRDSFAIHQARQLFMHSNFEEGKTSNTQT